MHNDKVSWDWEENCFRVAEVMAFWVTAELHQVSRGFMLLTFKRHAPIIQDIRHWSLKKGLVKARMLGSFDSPSRSALCEAKAAHVDGRLPPFGPAMRRSGRSGRGADA